MIESLKSVYIFCEWNSHLILYIHEKQHNSKSNTIIDTKLYNIKPT